MLALVFALGMLGACSSPSATTSASASASASSASGSAVDKIKSVGKIVMATNAAFPPYEYLGDDNKIVGVDVDIANEIAKDLGVKLEISDMDFDSIVAAVQAGKADFAAAGLTINDERKKSVDFSIEYATSSQYMIVKKDNTAIKTGTDLKGKVIGVQQGTTGDYYAADESVGAKSVERYKSGLDAASALKAGKIDAVVIDKLTAQAIVKANDDLSMIDEELTQESYAIAVPKGSQDLLKAINTTLQRLIDEGKIQEYTQSHISA